MTDSPPPPWEQIDYRRELELARLSRVSYLDGNDVGNRDANINPDHPHLFDEKLGPYRWRLLATRDFNDTSGFVAHAFIQDRPDRRIIIAIRGSDNAPDWAGPNKAVMRDGELLDLAGLPGPRTASAKAQMARVQDKVFAFLGDREAWDPQFTQALDFALELQRKYEPQGYAFEVTGHSLGGAHAQLLGHTFGWGGRAFDAPGAANLVEAPSYGAWLARHDVTPVGAPHFDRHATYLPSFINYSVNNSAVSGKSGPHLGDRQSISSFIGREGFGPHVRYATGLLGGAVKETPLLGEATRLALGKRRGALVGPGAHVAQWGVDALDRHDIGRIVRTFEEAVERQDRGARQPLPIFGDQARPSMQSLAQAREHPLQPPPSGAGADRFFDHLHAAMKTGDRQVFERALGAVADRDEARERHAAVVARVGAREQVASAEGRFAERVAQEAQAQQPPAPVLMQ